MSDRLNHHKPWLPSATRKLVRMVQDGKSWDEIAVALGRNAGGCRTRFQTVRSGTMWEMRRKAGIEPFWQPCTSNDNETFFAEYWKGKEPPK